MLEASLSIWAPGIAKRSGVDRVRDSGRAWSRCFRIAAKLPEAMHGSNRPN
jgi:hypothetical protein